MNDEPTKVCPHCHKEKFLWQFGKEKRTSSGVAPHCKECSKAVWKKKRNVVIERRGESFLHREARLLRHVTKID